MMYPLPGDGRTGRSPSVAFPRSTETRSEELPPHRTAQPDGSDFGHLLRLIWRRKLALATFVVTGIVVCAAAIVQMTPSYTARGLVLIDAPEARIVALEAVLSGVSAEGDAVGSETEVLQSADLADAVIDLLSLDRNPEFNPNLRTRTIWDTAKSVINYLRRLVLDVRSRVEASSPAEAERARVIDSVVSGLSIFPRERSRLLDVTFTSGDPVLAAKIVNTFLDLYIAQQVDKKYSATLAATDALSRNVTAWQKRTSEF